MSDDTRARVHELICLEADLHGMDFSDTDEKGGLVDSILALLQPEAVEPVERDPLLEIGRILCRDDLLSQEKVVKCHSIIRYETGVWIQLKLEADSILVTEGEQDA